MSRGQRPRFTRPILYQGGDTVRVLDVAPPLFATVTAVRPDQVRVSYHDGDGHRVTRWVGLAVVRQVTASEG